MPRNTACWVEHFFTVVYEQTSSHAEISGLVIKKYTKQMYFEGLLDQTASLNAALHTIFKNRNTLLK